MTKVISEIHIMSRPMLRILIGEIKYNQRSYLDLDLMRLIDQETEITLKDDLLAELHDSLARDMHILFDDIFGHLNVKN